MRFWWAVTYQLFAAGKGSPRASVTFRLLAFVASLLLLAGLLWRYVPPLHISNNASTLSAAGWLFSIVGVFLVGILTDAHQQAFLAKLTCFTVLPLRRGTLRGLYVYASAPIGFSASVLITITICRSLLGGLPWYYAVIVTAAGCVLTTFTDVLLRISHSSADWQSYIWRYSFMVCAAWLGYLLINSPDMRTIYQTAVVGMTLIMLALVIVLARRPVRTAFAAFRMPVVEGRPGIYEALPIRAMRTSRYMGTNFVLAVAAFFLVLNCRAAHPVLPVDGAVLMLLMLIGTLGQEVRALSPARYPIELTLYGAFRRWLYAQWLLGFLHGLMWIDITLWAVWLWAPHSLTVSMTEAGMIGLGFIAAGMAAGSIIVPQKHDILAQCASTGLYAGLLWAFMKIISAVDGYISAAIVGLLAVVTLSVVTWAAEYMRWQQTIRRRRSAN